MDEHFAQNISGRLAMNAVILQQDGVLEILHDDTAAIAA
jgi:hypothetical protein